MWNFLRRELDWPKLGRWLRNLGLSAFALWLIGSIFARGSAIEVANLTLKLAAAFVAAELALMFLRRLDRRLGVDWAEVKPKLGEVYFAARLVAVAIVLHGALAG